MPKGFLAHVDFSVGDPGLSIRFYDALLTELGYKRYRASGNDWEEPAPSRAAWGIKYDDGNSFGIDLRPAVTSPDRRYDRAEPGPHHMAFMVGSDEEVDLVFRAMVGVGAEVLDEPSDYGGRAGYGDHYYAVFFADPDGFKIEVVHAQGFDV